MEKKNKGTGTGAQMGLMLIGIAMLALLVAAFTSRILFVGVSFLCLGVGMLLFAMEGQAKLKVMAVCQSAYFILFGILLALMEVLQEKYGWKKPYSFYILGIGLGILMVATGIFNIAKRFFCNTKVEATYLGANRQQSKSVVQYVPRFSFTFQGDQYENTSGETYSRKKINKKYEVGKQYPIFVSEKNPHLFRTKAGVRVGDICMILGGLVFTIVPLLAL